MQTARAIDRENRRRQREVERNVRAAEKVLRAMQREEKVRYQQGRAQEADNLTREVAQTVDGLERILIEGISRDARINWQDMAHRPLPTMEGDPSLQLPSIPDLASVLPAEPGFFARLLPGRVARHQKEVRAARSKHAGIVSEHRRISELRAGVLSDHYRETHAQHNEVLALRNGYYAGQPEAVSAVFDLVLESSPLPDGFPRSAQIAYSPQSRQLVVDYQLPTMDDIVPEDDRFRYNKTSDEITSTKRSVKAKGSLYSDAVAATVLRSLHEIFQADEAGVIGVAVLNAYVNTIDPSTGQSIQPYLVSVRATRDQLGQIALANVNPIHCLKRLSASLSKSPAELAPVKPIVDIKTTDPRFIAERDVLSTLDSRPNLMELTPNDFETLITNLFQRMGLDTKQTQASRDGGVDCVAFDLRPVLGGKVIVQAKRYKNTVGVSAVRDLFGTMHNEGASKGILVTTSGYGSATFEFAKGKPIELIDGANLLYLLQEHAGIEAKIVPPEDWVEPRLDAR